MRGAAFVVDDVGDFAEVVEGDGDHVMEADAGRDGDFNGARQRDVGMAENAVDAESPGFVAGDVVGNFVRGPSVDAGSRGPACLVGRVVGNFGLVEVGAAVIAVPQHLELLMVLDEEAVGSDVVSIDNEAVVAEVAGPANAVAVIGAPDPGVVDDGVVGVDDQVDLGAAHACSTDAEEDVVKEDGIFSVRDVAALRTYFNEDGRDFFARIEEDPGDVDAISVCSGEGGCAVGGPQGGEAEPDDESIGALDLEWVR